MSARTHIHTYILPTCVCYGIFVIAGLMEHAQLLLSDHTPDNAAIIL